MNLYEGQRFGGLACFRARAMQPGQLSSKQQLENVLTETSLTPLTTAQPL